MTRLSLVERNGKLEKDVNSREAYTAIETHPICQRVPFSLGTGYQVP